MPVVGVIMLIGTGMFCGSASWAQQEPKRIEISKGIQLTLMEGWAEVPSRYTNAVELVTPPEAAKTGAPAAKIVITTERRTDYNEALRRIAEIAREYKGKLEFLAIGGWPALQRHYAAPLPQRGQNRNVGDKDVSLRVTTAIAYLDLLLRIECTLALDAKPELADQAATMSRTVTFSTQADPEQVKKELKALSAVHKENDAGGPGGPGDPPDPMPPGDDQDGPAPSAAAGTPVSVRAGVGELEIAVSNNGQNLVVGTNAGYAFSNNGGSTFTAVAGGTPAPFPRDGDPSLAFGVSGAFYYGFIGFPNGTPAAGGVTGCSTGISVSVDNGATFVFRNHAVLCPQSGTGICFPDQEHIAADPVNAAPAGGDQVYSVWRNFTPAGMATSCNSISSGFVTPSLVCSQDGGNNWTAPLALGAGDFPRITTAPNGNIYVVYRVGGNLMLDRYTACSAGLARPVGFPRVVAAVNRVACPVAGLDRCNNGNDLSSHTVALDDTNPNHVYVAYAINTAPNNENIQVRDSIDGGTTWPAGQAVTLNSPVNARRFMPWVCTENGSAYVSWYDRRAATVSNNDLTDFYVGGVSVQAGSLVAHPERNLSVNADPHCASGWPCGTRAVGDSEQCSVQPQLAGRCRTSTGGGSNTACDFSTTVCPVGETCQTGSGCPKYGDYNGIGCADGRVFTAWASATAPPGLPVAAGLTTYGEVVGLADFYVRDWTDDLVSGDDGAEPSTHSVFYKTSDVWNRRGSLPGSFTVDDQPPNEDAGNGVGNIGDNWAFARIRRNASPVTGSSQVVAHFLVSKLGTGSNYVDAGVVDPDVTFIGPDPTVAFNAGDLGPAITSAYRWHLNAVTSTHLCLAVEISAVGDPFVAPSLVGAAPGWPTTDLRVINDNNKAQRNMGLSKTPARGEGGSPGWSAFYAIAHNAATYTRDMELRYRATQGFREAHIRIVGERDIPLRPAGTVVLERMLPGENRWVGLAFEAPNGEVGTDSAVDFFEVVDDEPINGFSIVVRPSSMRDVLASNLDLHRAVFTRLAASFACDGDEEQAVAPLAMIRSESTYQDGYSEFLRCVPEIAGRAMARLVPDRSEDPFGIWDGIKLLSEASAKVRPSEGGVEDRQGLRTAAMFHTALLNKLDSFLTMIQLRNGDTADILQMVRWQLDLFAKRLPNLDCSRDLQRDSQAFIEAFTVRRAGVREYPQYLGQQLRCLSETARLLGCGGELERRAGALAKVLDSPTMLQKAHREYLLALQDAIDGSS